MSGNKRKAKFKVGQVVKLLVSQPGDPWFGKIIGWDEVTAMWRVDESFRTSETYYAPGILKKLTKREAGL